jgi:hypothetical protein
VPAAAAVVTWHRPRLFAAFATAALIAIAIGRVTDPATSVLRGRTFYGTHAVRDLPDARARALFHGTTLHGLQSLRPDRRRDPLSYYGPNSPVADVFRQRGGPGARVAVVGLGAGVILRYAKPGSEWTIYEIDPAIARLAQDPSLFTHWSEAAVTPSLVIGDGRLRLRDAPDGAYDLIIVDAFASDSVPVHMLTRQAMELYARKLRRGGAALFNVSNRYVDLTTVVGATVRPAGLAAYQRGDTTEDLTVGIFPSSWVLVGHPSTLTPPTSEWAAVELLPTDRPWTDDFSNVFAVLRPIRHAREVMAVLGAE